VNKKLAINIIPLIIAVVLFNCNSSSDLKKLSDKKKDSNKNSVTAYNPYFPISEGNSWEYINQGPRDKSEIFTVRMVSVSEDGMDKIVELNSFPFFSKKEESTRLRIKEDGSVYLLNGTREDLCIPSANNFKNGYTWNFAEWNCSVTVWNDTVQTENGNYSNCIFLNYSISITFSAELWLAKDVGIVKWTYIRTNPPTLNPVYYVLKNMTLSK
jgi:hypothetical protein